MSSRVLGSVHSVSRVVRRYELSTVHISDFLQAMTAESRILKRSAIEEGKSLKGRATILEEETC